MGDYSKPTNGEQAAEIIGLDAISEIGSPTLSGTRALELHRFADILKRPSTCNGTTKQRTETVAGTHANRRSSQNAGRIFSAERFR